jgi:3-oxoacyl-[acyl-carrier-protein] synthase-3
MIAAGAVKKGLLLVGDKSASPLDPLFSDAGTATALEFDAAAPPMYFDLNSDGSGYKAIMKPIGGHREPYSFHHSMPIRDDEGSLHWPDALILDGPAVLSFSTQRVPPTVNRALEYAKLAKESVDYFIFHQANRMINETIRKKLGLPEEKVPSTLYDFGNTSGASIPLTVSVNLNEVLTTRPHRLLFGGFGVGLSWGVCTIDISNAVFPPLLEV